jgi:hypothetical protein
MLFRAAKILEAILSVALITSTFAHTLCSVDEVVVKGRVTVRLATRGFGCS